MMLTVRRVVVTATAVFLLGAASLAVAAPGATDRGDDEPNLRYEVEAEDARLNREVLGEVVATVDDVPAEPVNSFVWDGEGSVPIEGSVRLEVDPLANSGEIVASWTDPDGNQWQLRQNTFVPPDHANGLRVGSSGAMTELESGDAVPTNVYLHGDTTAGGAVLPTVFNLVATWGPAEVTRNGELFENPFDGPAPLWEAHTMTTVGVRDADGIVHTVDGDVFDPTVDPSNGAVDNDDLEFHVVFHDAPGPEMTDNFPPPFSFFYHVVFEEVTVEIK